MKERRQEIVPADRKATFYLGGYGQPGEVTVRGYALDPATGRCALTMTCDSLRNPSYLLRHPRRPVLYAAEETEPVGGVVALAVEGEGLRRLASFPSGGAGPCHLALSPDGRHLFVSHYAGGSLTVFELDDNGVPARVSDAVQHVMGDRDREGANPLRQERAHIHFALCDGESVFVVDLGLNQVFVYGWDAERGRLMERGERLDFPKGAGPRHLTLSGDGRFLYVLCELNAQAHVFERDAQGQWRRVQVVSTVPEDFTAFADFDYSIGAAIRLVDGGTLCVSTRGRNSIALFDVSTDGTLSNRRVFPSEGRTPRDFAVIGGCLLAANQDSGSLTVFGEPDESGAYRLLHRVTEVGQPSCVCPAT